MILGSDYTSYTLCAYPDLVRFRLTLSMVPNDALDSRNLTMFDIFNSLLDYFSFSFQNILAIILAPNNL